MNNNLKPSQIIRDASKRLINFAHELGYSYREVKGFNGHVSILGGGHEADVELVEDGGKINVITKNKEIVVGTDRDEIGRLLILAHEIGHILDYNHNIPCGEELLWIVVDFPTYKHSSQHYYREVAAWDYAEDVIEGLGLGDLLWDLEGLRKFSLWTYRKTAKWDSRPPTEMNEVLKKLKFFGRELVLIPPTLNQEKQQWSA